MKHAALPPDPRRDDLIAQGAEALADALIALARRYDPVERVIARLVAKPSKAVQAIRKEMAKLGTWRNLFHRRDANVAAERMRAVLDDIRAAVQDPEQGTTLLLQFYQTDARVFESADDSDGLIGDVYRSDAVALFVAYAKQHPNPTQLAQDVLALVASDNYGIRDALTEAAHQYLPDAVIDHIIETHLAIWDAARLASPPRSADRPYNFDRLPGDLLLRSLAKQRHNAALFERLILASTPDPGNQYCTEIAQVYLAAGNPLGAMRWLRQIKDISIHSQSDADQLRIQIAQAQGDTVERDAAALREFQRGRSAAAFEALLAIVGEPKRSELKQSERAAILQSQQLHVGDVEFLCEFGFDSDAEAHVLKHADQLNGRDYFDLPELATTLKKRKRILAATLIWRALLDDILINARLKAYGHGRKYLAALDAAALTISDWRGVTPHLLYRAELGERHARKTSFWRSDA